MKITVLVENSTSCRLYGEHGLSVYIEYDGKKYLLDTGASTLFAKNAKELGISLADIDTAFLSHAHYDHSEDLKHFSKKMIRRKFICRTLLRKIVISVQKPVINI